MGISKQGDADVQISEARFLLIAVGIHAAIPLVALLAPRPKPAFATESVQALLEIEVEPSKEAPETPRPATVTLPQEEARKEEPLPSHVEAPTNVTGHVEPGPAVTGPPSNVEAPSTAGSVASAAPAGTSEYDGPPPAVLTAPNGLSPIGAQPWQIAGALPLEGGRAAAAPTVAPKATVDPHIATKVLTEAIKEKDKGLGLDLPAAGTIATSVRGAVQASALPSEATGTFEVRLSPTGQVLGVRVTSSAGGSSDTWGAAAKMVQAAVSGRAFTLGSGYEKGAVVYVSVKSTLTLPDGTKSVIERKGAGATFDVSNIGAHMQRVVKTSFSVVAVK
ncbi:MAG: hypothetical protein U0441_13765 [Polyangiaceae bacterium]